MKKVLLIVVFCIMTLIASIAQNKDGFVIEGDIMGMPDSTKVVLTSMEGGKKTVLSETFSKGSEFLMEGKIDIPSLYELSLSVYKSESDYYVPVVKVPIMIENVPIAVQSVVPFDSLRRARYEYAQLPLLEMKGGKAMEEWKFYSNEVNEIKKHVKQMGLLLADKYFESRANKDTVKKYELMKEAADLLLFEANRSFVKQHPSYHISAYLVCEELSRPFVYTKDELQAMAAIIQVPDTARMNKVHSDLSKSLRYAINEPFKDFEITTQELDTVFFSNYVKPGQFTLIDFWASWCGPCRIAIPEVDALSKKYTGRLNICSISIDKEEGNWRKAMNEESMPWTQFWASTSQFKNIYDLYHVAFIPHLVLLDGTGKIVCVSNSTDDIESVMDRKINNNII